MRKQSALIAEVDRGGGLLSYKAHLFPGQVAATHQRFMAISMWPGKDDILRDMDLLTWYNNCPPRHLLPHRDLGSPIWSELTHRSPTK